MQRGIPFRNPPQTDQLTDLTSDVQGPGPDGQKESTKKGEHKS